MEAHAEKSRKIQKRAQEQFEAIVQEETEKAQLQAVAQLVNNYANLTIQLKLIF